MKRCNDCYWVVHTHPLRCNNFAAIPDKCHLRALAEELQPAALLCRDESEGGKCGLEGKFWEPKPKPKPKPLWKRLGEWLRGRAET